jgi:cytochrome c biogenesis protein CcmG, thiol:disulfide interchange protein DsbE
VSKKRHPTPAATQQATARGGSRPRAGKATRAAPGVRLSAGYVVAAVVLVGAVAGGFLLARGLPGGLAPSAAPTVAAPSATAAPAQAAVPDANPLVGRPAPAIVGTTLDGQPASLADYSGKPVLVNFWATWCPPCRQEMPWLQQAYQSYQAKGFVVLAVNAGERVNPTLTLQKIQRFVAANNLTMPILLPTSSDQTQMDYLASALPTSVLVGRDGVITNVVSGAFPNSEAVESAVQRLLETSTVTN